MPRRSLSVLAVMVFLTAHSPCARAQTTKASPVRGKAHPGLPPGYKKAVIHGFTLLIHETVYQHNDDAEWKRKPLEVLELELLTIVKRLPARYVAGLRKILLWVEWEDKSDPDLAKGAIAKYYGTHGNLVLWSLGKNKHPGKANNVEVISMRGLTQAHQPGVKFERSVLLHELAHAVHHQALGGNNAVITATYQQAMKRKLYDQVKDIHGRLGKAYAARNEREYFAELTCAYLDRLHYFPFTADDLKKHDPQGYSLMEKLWGPRQKLDAVLKAQAERVAVTRIDTAERLHRAGMRKEGIAAMEKLLKDYPETKAATGAKKTLTTWKEKKK